VAHFLVNRGLVTCSVSALASFSSRQAGQDVHASVLLQPKHWGVGFRV
jgi:hypothetical protein